jgi:SAM-dependent methyltransferase
MAQKQSDYVLPATEAESIRLERQARLYGGTDFLDRFIEGRPARVLEVGCGTGFFARYVAAQLPQSRVVGLDSDEGRLGFASAKEVPANLNYQCGQMSDLPFEDGAFDFVFSRFVLVHATDSGAAMSEMARVTRSGGTVAAYDMVHSGIWFSPLKPAFDKVLQAAMDIMRGVGMEPDQGLHLGPSMIRAGFKGVRVQPIPHTFLASDPMYEAYRTNWIETVSCLDEVLQKRFDHSELEAAVAELVDPSPDQGLLETTILAWGEKP